MTIMWLSYHCNIEMKNGVFNLEMKNGHSISDFHVAAK